MLKLIQYDYILLDFNIYIFIGQPVKQLGSVVTVIHNIDTSL